MAGEKEAQDAIRATHRARNIGFGPLVATPAEDPVPKQLETTLARMVNATVQRALDKVWRSTGSGGYAGHESKFARDYDEERQRRGVAKKAPEASWRGDGDLLVKRVELSGEDLVRDLVKAEHAGGGRYELGGEPVDPTQHTQGPTAGPRASFVKAIGDEADRLKAVRDAGGDTITPGRIAEQRMVAEALSTWPLRHTPLDAPGKESPELLAAQAGAEELCAAGVEAAAGAPAWLDRLHTQGVLAEVKKARAHPFSVRNGLPEGGFGKRARA